MDKQESEKKEHDPTQGVPESSLLNDVGKIPGDVSIECQSDPKQTQTPTTVVPKPSRIKRLVRLPKTLWESLEEANTNRVIAIATAIIALATCLSTYEIVSSSRQTDKIISSAQDIKGALQKANAQNLQSINRTLAQSQKNADLSNAESNTALQATIAKYRLDQRAWITVEVGEKTGNFAVAMRNTGKTPAVNVTDVTAFSVSDRLGPPTVDLTQNSSSPVPIPKNAPPEFIKALKKEGFIRSHPPTGYVIAPGDSQISSDYQGKFSQIFGWDRSNPRSRAYIQGRVTYNDIFGARHETDYCFWFAPPSDFVMCNDHNKMN